MSETKFPSGLNHWGGPLPFNPDLMEGDNEVLDQFIARVMSLVVPTATILSYAGELKKNWDPAGFLFLWPEGRTVSRETYADLYAKIGTTYGTGDGETTFSLPNPAGRFLLGYDANLGVGSTGGEDTHKLTIVELPKHQHKTGYTDQYWTMNAVMGLEQNLFVNHTASINTTIVGGDQPHQNMPPYLATTFIIKT